MHLLLPLASSLLYVVAALFLKQSASRGIDIWRTSFVCNVFTAVVFSLLWQRGGEVPSWSLLYQPLLVGVLFIGAQLLTFLALKSGDVSVTTPVMGSKVVLVAFFSQLLGAGEVPPPLWVAAVLSSVGIAFLNRQGGEHRYAVARTIGLALAAASCYSLYDVLVVSWSPAWGAGRFLPISMWMSGVLSFGFIPLFRPLSESHHPWRSLPLFGGALFIAMQSIILVSGIAIYGDATAINVIYSTRGLWSVVAVWWLGHWFSNNERFQGGPEVFRSRLIGAVCLCLAVVLVFV